MLLATPSKTYKFSLRKSEDAENRFLRLLRLQSTTTENIKIATPDDVLLDHNGLLQGRFRLSTTAFGQMCSKLVAWLSNVLGDIGGLKLSTRKDSIVDQGLAIRWFNEAAKLRFETLRGCTMVIDRKARQVEGVVGRKYEFFPNIDLYEQVSNFTRQEFGSNTEFCEAVVAGRRMFVRFRGKKLFEIPAYAEKKEPYYCGFHFANSEVGECSIRACVAIIRQWSDGKAISPFCDGGGKLPHYSGPTFDQRFQKLLDAVKMQAEGARKLRPKLCELSSINLNLGGDKAKHNKRFNQLLERLVRKGVARETAFKALKRAMHYGSYKSDAIILGQRPFRQFQKRTAYDLFNALTHVAKACGPAERERTEQVAYKLVLSNFNWS